MNKEKIISYAAAAFELTKMVLIISANTTIKLVGVGKKEVVKQYTDYQKGKRGIDFSALKDLTKELSDDVKRSIAAGQTAAAAKPIAAKPQPAPAPKPAAAPKIPPPPPPKKK
ncbi:unnamed protein product [Callosobruchus maculatus]|uniref:Uncharacterized protein n=1 Tax=Callosobruchus maculatus TaxID=64391 RepID=A0A653C479_CALMS|nr:unnamed protein product [Callosobruchus maculatus]